MVKENALISSVNFSLGALFIIDGIVKIKDAAKSINKNKKLWWMPLAHALLSIILGVVALVASNNVMKTYIFVIGTLMIIEGLREVIVEIFEL